MRLIGRTGLALAGLASAGALVAGYLWSQPPDPLPLAAAPVRFAAAVVAEPAPPDVVGRDPVVPLSARVAAVRVTLLRQFHGVGLADELVEALVAGEVASVARALAASQEPTAAARLYDLEALCASESAPDRNRTQEENAALAVTAGEEAARATLNDLIGARHDWQERVAAGCAAATIDAAREQKRLAASAAAGDAASLERLASTDAAPLARLQSAALLGSARAQFRLALESLPHQPPLARTWFEAAAKGDADAEAYYGTCLLSGCFGPADVPAARTALESAARRGASAAIGLLIAGSGTGGLGRWSPADALAVAIAPREPEALEIDASERYAWATLAEALARDGCFGFDVTTTAEALTARAVLEPTLRPPELAAAQAAAEELATATGAATRHARGCD